MKACYNVTGATRKELVGIIGNTVGMKPVYKAMPTCAYAISNIIVEKDGTMVWDERTDAPTIQKVIDALATAGFTAEIEGAEELAAAHEVDSPSADETLVQDSATTDTAAAEPEDGLTISLPLDGFTDASIDNLKKLVASKAALIRKALNADRLDIETEDGKISFPWWDRLPEPAETQTYMAFIAALCKMAKEAKRVTAREAEVESEKYAFRCFLLRLGFIGSECKDQRKILMQRLSGTAAFPNAEKADAFSAAQKAKRDAAKTTETEEVAVCE